MNYNTYMNEYRYKQDKDLIQEARVTVTMCNLLDVTSLNYGKAVETLFDLVTALADRLERRCNTPEYTTSYGSANKATRLELNALEERLTEKINEDYAELTDLMESLEERLAGKLNKEEEEDED